MRKLRCIAPRTCFILAIVIAGALFMGACSSSSKRSSATTTTAAGSSAGSGGSSRSAGDAVQIKGFAFGPKTLNVKTGTRVTWTNKDSTDHTVTADKSDPGTFDSGHVSTGKSFSFRFTKAGTYKYICSIHKSMTATVVVS